MASVLAAGGTARAGALDGNFPAERMRGTLDRDGIVDIESAHTPLPAEYDAALWLGWANDPLVLVDRNTGERVAPLVSNRLGGSLTASVGLAEIAQVGVELPFIAFQHRVASPAALGLPPLAVAGIGDVRVAGKLKLIDASRYWADVAVVPSLTIPTGGGKDFFGEPGFTLVPEVVASRRFGPIRAALDVSFPIRPRAQLLDQIVETEFSVKVGAAWRFREETPQPIDVALAVATAASLLQPFRNANQTPLEVKTQVTYYIDEHFAASGGAGLGIVPGWGTPDWRFFLGFRYAHRILDRDADGILDRTDRCVLEPEDKDEFEDDDGCPDPDNDGDGVRDIDDRCPADPEDRDGFMDQDGCPDPDNDGDLIADADDGCPMEAEDPDLYEDTDGCPEPDNDGDGVPDVADNCPLEPGVPENQGCRARQVVIIRRQAIEIADSVYFKLGLAVIERKSYRLLDNVAAVIKSHPEIKKIRIEGHTDNQGNPNANLTLSQRRAEAVLEYLVKKGVERERLRPIGYGATQPIADNKTKAGRAKNRRVMFVIVESGGVKVKTQSEGPTEETMER